MDNTIEIDTLGVLEGKEVLWKGNLRLLGFNVDESNVYSNVWGLGDGFSGFWGVCVCVCSDLSNTIFFVLNPCSGCQVLGSGRLAALSSRWLIRSLSQGAHFHGEEACKSR